MFEAPTHGFLLAVGLGGTLLLVVALRKERTWPAVLLWLAPVALALSTTDGLLRVISPLHNEIDRGDHPSWLIFALLFCIVLPATVIVHQRLLTLVTGGGLHHQPAPSSDENS